MATVTNWVDHLTASEVAGQIYPYVGTELWWVIAGIVFWLWWTILYSYWRSRRTAEVS